VVRPFADNEITNLTDTGEAPLPLRDDLRLEGGVPIAWDVDLDRTDLGQHGLDAVPVAGVPAVPARRVVAVVAEVVGDLALQRGLVQALGQLREQPALAGQLQPARSGPASETGNQLLVDRVQLVRARRPVAYELVQVHALLLGHHVSHRVLPP
jgi:hypothetical protein